MAVQAHRSERADGGEERRPTHMSGLAMSERAGCRVGLARLRATRRPVRRAHPRPAGTACRHEHGGDGPGRVGAPLVRLTRPTCRPSASAYSARAPSSRGHPMPAKATRSKVNKVVLAYSGGLDTSIILKWLQQTYRAEVVTFTADLG